MNRRKHHRSKRVVTPSKAEPMIGQTDSASVSIQTSEAAIVRQDLRTTLVTTAILVTLLIVSSIINQKIHWTSEAGSFIYQLLHIR